MKPLSAFYWWVIPAAFIGPGTVTTAARAGAMSGYDLAWAVVFSVFACVMLQEASARVTIVTGRPLAQLMGDYLGRWVMFLVALAVGVGCVAYEAGNVVGAASGLELTGVASLTTWVWLVGISAGVLLWYGSVEAISRWLGFAVLLMGLCFMFAAWVIFDRPGDFVQGLVVPRVPDNGWLNVIGLVGTTVVPYALFLGSGIAKGREVPEMRRGITASVVVGGLITMAILVTGTAVQGEFSFVGLSAALTEASSPIFSVFFSLGLFAAGFTSAITAPTALALVVGSVWPQTPETALRLTRVGVLAVGMVVSLTGIRPVAIILAAQGLNGILLPLTALTAALVLHHPGVRNLPYAAGPIRTVGLWVSVAVSIGLGATAIVRLL